MEAEVGRIHLLADALHVPCDKRGEHSLAEHDRAHLVGDTLGDAGQAHPVPREWRRA